MEPFSHMFGRKNRIEMKVDEESQFRSDTQAFADEEGLAPEESLVMEKSRLEAFEQIRKDCAQISTASRVLVWLLNILFIMSLFIGLFLRIAIPESNIDRVGDCLMMIGGLGILLVYFKQTGASLLRTGSTSFRLGLNKNSPPVAFDEQGRSPFDRVRAGE